MHVLRAVSVMQELPTLGALQKESANAPAMKKCTKQEEDLTVINQELMSSAFILTSVLVSNVQI